jgi:hypothetical protein
MTNNSGYGLDDWIYWSLLHNHCLALPPFWVVPFWSLYSDPNCVWLHSDSESYGMTDGQSASLSWNKASIWALRPDFHYCQTVAGLLIWGALSEERTGLFFTIVAGPASAVIFGSESRGTRDHILLSQIRDFPFRRLLRLWGGIRPFLHTRLTSFWSERPLI